MELTFDYEDIKDVFEKLNITIHDVYFGSRIHASTHISTHMYWIGPADAFDYYQKPEAEDVWLLIKGKWLNIEVVDDTLIRSEIVAWLKTQKHVNCRYYIDGTGTGTIGSMNEDEII